MKKFGRYLVLLFCLCLSIYGCSRLYFHLTDGFQLSNITSHFPYQKDWDVHDLKLEEQLVIHQALNQPYFYLGKGCQSYAFLSEDGEYVIKFFKYQRYRLQFWLDYFFPLPAIIKYKQEKLAKKWHKLDGFVKSWKLAFDYLKEETGLLFVHLNKTSHLNHSLIIFDKLGFKHTVSLDQMEFCLQRRADLLCSVLMQYQQTGELQKAKQLIDRLLHLILSEYKRGFADNDHALMQNTGIVHEQPIHIDVGQFVYHNETKETSFYHQELFTKTYKFKLWLAEHYPELKNYLDQELEKIIGAAYQTMQPKFKQR